MQMLVRAQTQIHSRRLRMLENQALRYQSYTNHKEEETSNVPECTAVVTHGAVMSVLGAMTPVLVGMLLKPFASTVIWIILIVLGLAGGGSISGVRVRVVDLFISWILRVINMWRLGSALSKDLWIVLCRLVHFQLRIWSFKRRFLRGLVSVSLCTFNTDNNNETQRAEGSRVNQREELKSCQHAKKKNLETKLGREYWQQDKKPKPQKQTQKQWLQSHRKKSSKQNMLKDSSLWIQKHQKQSGKKQFLEVFHNF